MTVEALLPLLRTVAEHTHHVPLRRDVIRVIHEIEADERATEAAIERLSWHDAQMEMAL